MDYLKTYKNFIHSQHVYEGIRITAGVLFPAFLMNFFGHLTTGIIFSIGALFVSVTDSPGPIHHRRNGMMWAIVSLFVVSMVAGLSALNVYLLGISLLLACFVFSMIAVYGARASSIGIAALLAFCISIGGSRHEGWKLVEYALFITSGGLWYMLFSMLLHNFRPYKLTQQALGDWVQSIGDYLAIRAQLYKKDVDYEDIYKQLLQKQTEVQDKQNVVNELIFKTRSIIKESTHTGRILVMMYLDAADIFERIMTSYQQYSMLHTFFDETNILNEYYDLANQISGELFEIGIAIKSGTPSVSDGSLMKKIKETRRHRDELRVNYINPENIDGFISLRRIMENITDLAERIQTLHRYTSYDQALAKRKKLNLEYGGFTSEQDFSLRLLIDNLSFKSDIFRHSIRLCLAVAVGYTASLVFNIGHMYWILLTIVVILKPAYSLTKTRNKDRLLGTILGAIIGIIILQLINNNTVLLFVMIICMIGNFMFMRRNYFLTVLLMTPYIVLFYHFLNPNDFRTLLVDRVIDTAIGSVIAFVTFISFMPNWERQKIKSVMIKMLEEALHYFTIVEVAFEGDKTISLQEQQTARKDALVALANLSAAFNRMLSEPKNQQKGIEDIHRFVVLNHMLTSYIASLSAYLKVDALTYASTDFNKVVDDIKQYFCNAIDLLNDKPLADTLVHKESLSRLNEETNSLLEKRKVELQHGQLETSTKKTLFELKSIVDQFNLIYKVAFELNKLSSRLATL